MNKRQAILEKAVELFGSKGYQQTSIKEIADQLQISKGSVYSYFESKEDLIISIYEHYQQLTFERAFIVSLDSTLPIEERIVKQFKVQFEGISEYKSYMMMHMRGEGASSSDKLKGLEHRMRGRFFTWLAQSITDLFGVEILPYKWDLCWMIQSIYTAYMRLFASEQAPLKPEQLAQHLVTQMKQLGESYLKGESLPLLTEEHMAPFAVKMDEDGAFVPFKQREEAWKKLYKTIDTFKGEEKRKYQECANRISEEAGKERPEWLVIKGLCLVMKEEPSLADPVTELESLLFE
ncbi:TetR/AcrR family transcriptional regulator [Bacillus suaedae]|uniref:TetR/AcrR family transcriptional regulator n=1 Tax=Halalkalibacter suaedae TaxID=2822140 RepID=A0A941ASU1_9BACI|nr:TetR/AcrR family transcriptional regulator [Bacillus suaedae]MBP3949949.1 TetR/AcrR family transcriptional regulator [Bacillus suaedae]